MKEWPYKGTEAPRTSGKPTTGEVLPLVATAGSQGLARGNRRWWFRSVE
jgi:hypothetical protein